MSDLRKLDEEIALLRGWFTTDLGTWTPRDESHAVRDAWDVEVMCGRENDPPPFSSSWALAGPLLEELQGDAPHDMTLWRLAGAWHVDANGSCHSGATPCEAIARAWVDWKRGKA